MTNCTKCGKEVPFESNDIPAGFVHPKSDAMWRAEALAAGNAEGQYSTKQYPVCRTCYRELWDQEYPGQPCPITETPDG